MNRIFGPYTGKEIEQSDKDFLPRRMASPAGIRAEEDDISYRSEVSIALHVHLRTKGRTPAYGGQNEGRGAVRWRQVLPSTALFHAGSVKEKGGIPLGKIALAVFLAALGTGLVDLLLLVRSALSVYRTLNAAYDDYRAWSASFTEKGSRMYEGLRRLEGRAGSILETMDRVRESVEDIQDTLEEMRSSPLLRAARFLGRHRPGA